MGGVNSLFKQDISYFYKYFCSLLLSNVDEISLFIDGYNIKPYIGPLWFLWALFWCKEIFYLMQYILRNTKYQNESILCVCFIISSFLYLINWTISLPFCISQGISVIIFYAIGYYIKDIKHNFKFNTRYLFILSCLILSWVISIFYGGINLESNYIKLYPIEILGSLGVSIIIYKLIHLMLNVKIFQLLFSPLKWCGRFSLAILCMHTLELYSGVIYSFISRIPQLSYLLGYGQILISILMAVIVLRIPILKSIYK